ncbi:MAG TPA: aminoglycoside 6-adenylyltransferase [Candidatus Limiplasma sp.]|nr:aminoglycoside 6-adenylyltransferase [Candidatus Limiplasma sp.]HRX08106.1 aminoglycoside 6-adenylyltransferase [Candidatus Limiplasma sp.]
MHPDLEQSFSSLVEILKADPRCKGGWHYGSVGRGEADEYSDYDPVYLVADTDFKSFAADVPNFMRQVCDELLISWAEDYNDDHFRNYCNLIRIGDTLHQMDFFILNADTPETWFCRQHLKGCTRDNIIFDRTGEVSALLDRGLTTDNYIPDPVRCMDTYWFHLEMLIKYFKRGDIFKLLKNIDFLFHAHQDLLLSQYDCLHYGAPETKVKKCVPKDKQAHLLSYFAPAEPETLKKQMLLCMRNFAADAAEVCAAKNIQYPPHIAQKVIEYFERSLA